MRLLWGYGVVCERFVAICEAFSNYSEKEGARNKENYKR